ncbi:MAG: NAD(P)-dependent oxidoreductase [Clostridiales bacterium]|nr:NAD(P)-dependent oxidoreductase [Clostridiales bacterium]
MIIDEDILEIARYIKNLEIKNKKILITGATGLIGSLMVKGFVCANQNFKLNNKIYALVRTKEKANLVFSDMYLDGIIVVQGDIRDEIDISEDVDIIYHAAAITTSSTMISNPVGVIDISVNGSKNVFDFAVKHNAKSVVYLSSMEVYGTIDAKRRLGEQELGYIDLSSIRNCYPESKRMVENLVRCYAEQYNLNVTTARLTQTFGPGISYDNPKIFNLIARSVIENNNIILSTKGESARDYCYTTDAINAILIISVKGEAGECYNIANENTHMSIYEMAKFVCANIANGSIDVLIQEGDNSKYMAPSVIKLDTSKLMKLGWSPKYGLKEMYERLIDSYNIGYDETV